MCTVIVLNICSRSDYIGEVFSKRCTLSERLESGEWKDIAMGELQEYYDSDPHCARISVKDDNESIVSVTTIGINTVMEVNV